MRMAGAIGSAADVIGDPFAVPTDRHVQLVGLRGTVAEAHGGAEGCGPAGVAQDGDAGPREVGLERDERRRGGRTGTGEQERVLIPRTCRQAFTGEKGEGRADRGTEVFVAAAGERQELRAVVGAVTVHRAVRLHERLQEPRGGERAATDRRRQGASGGALHHLGPAEETEQQAVVVGGMLAEAAVRRDERQGLTAKGLQSEASPAGGVSQAGPEGPRGEQAHGAGDAVVVALRKRVVEVREDPPRGDVGEAGRQTQARAGRGG